MSLSIPGEIESMSSPGLQQVLGSKKRSKYFEVFFCSGKTDVSALYQENLLPKHKCYLTAIKLLVKLK